MTATLDRILLFASPTSILGSQLKIVSVMVISKLHFFPNPQIFLHIQRELPCNNLSTIQQHSDSIFLEKRDNSLLLGVFASKN